MDAVIFAAWMPKAHRGPIYINSLKHYYRDCDIYVGLNPGEPIFEQHLIASNFTSLSKVPNNLVVNSDASAYQAALKSLKDSRKVYDKVHFLHTKGVSYASDTQWMTSCESYFLGYCKRRKEVTDGFAIGSYIGGVSYVGQSQPMNNSGYSDAIDRYCSFKQKEVENIMSLVTFYSIRGDIVNNFLKNCTKEFFSDKMDRYFFETSFPLIVDKSGFKRHHLNVW